MITLFNGCYCTELKVHPENWNQKGASCTDDWYIWYRFYDPAIRDAAGKIKPKLCLVKGMNREKTLAARRQATQILLQEEMEILTVSGFNPITRQMMAPERTTDGPPTVDPLTPFCDALDRCLELMEAKPETKRDIRSNLRYIRPALDQLRFTHLPIRDVRRKHIKALLHRLSIIKPQMLIKEKGKPDRPSTWTNNTFNQYRKNLSILFEELIELEATEVNPVHGIKRKKHAPKKRPIPTPEECERIDEFTREHYPRFWMLIHIFHHSGARTTELFNVQGEHVDLRRQAVKYLVLKGRNYEWVERPIVDVALSYWEMAMQGCGRKDFVFSTGLKPGPKPISPRQVTRRWRVHIKEKLGITCDWYALKHLNTTRNMDAAMQVLKNVQLEVARFKGYKSEKMIAKVYDISSGERFRDLLNNSAGLV